MGSALADAELDKFAIFRDLGYEPHRAQVPVHQSTAPRRVLACGVREGKTKSVTWEAIAAGLEPSSVMEPRRGWVVAPTYELADKAFREIVLVANERLSHMVLKSSASERLLLMRNMGGGVTEIKGKTADNPVNLLGEGLDFLIVDEAARMKPDIYERYLEARLLDKGGWAMLISTPRGKGWFWDLYKRGLDNRDPDYQSWNLPTWSNPYINRNSLRKLKLVTPSSIWKQEYCAEFLEGDGQVFRNIAACAIGQWLRPFRTANGTRDPHRLYSAGLDLAQVEDYTVLTVIDDLGRVVFLDRFHRVPWSVQGARLKVALARFGNPPTLVDSTGMGQPVFEGLQRLGLNVVPYPLTNASKCAIIDNLCLLFERQEVTLPQRRLCPILLDELESYEYTISPSGNVKSNAPSGSHDDCVISLALAAWQSSNRPYFHDAPQDEWERDPVLFGDQAA
jgi:hypothetical protein